MSAPNTRPMFTPGPWNASNGGCGPGTFRIYSEEPSVFLCAAFSTDYAGAEQVESNARLISAAPEMYEALRAIAERYEECWKIGDSAGLRALGAARAALAKAEGRA